MCDKRLGSFVNERLEPTVINCCCEECRQIRSIKMVSQNSIALMRVLIDNYDAFSPETIATAFSKISQREV